MVTDERPTLRDEDAERAVLGEGLRLHDRYVARGLSPDDYAVPEHRVVAVAMAAVWEAGSTVDLDSVGLYLQRSGQIDRLGGQRWLAELAATGGRFPDADRVRDLRRARDLYAAAQEVMVLASRGAVLEAMSALASLQVDAVGGRGAPKTKTAAEVAEVALSGLIDDARNNRRVWPGLDGLQRCIGSYQPGNLYIFGASTNVGKSSLALASMMGMADAERPTTSGYVSFEDGDDVVGARLLAHVSGVSSRKFTGALGPITEHDMGALGMGVDTLRKYRGRLLFDDCTGGNELDACAAMTRQAQQGAKVVFLDYIQEIEASQKQDDRRNAIRWVAGRLKAHARRVGVAVVLLSQVTDGADDKRRPTHKDLRDCKDLGNKAEGVLMGWRKEVADDAPIQVYLSKGKSGGLGTEFYMRRTHGGRLVEVDASDANFG